MEIRVGQVVRGHRFKRPSGPGGIRLAAAQEELSSRMNAYGSSDSNNGYWRAKLMDRKFLLRCARRLSEHEEFARRTEDDSKPKRKPRHPLSKHILSSEQPGVRRSRLPGAGRQFRFPDARKRLRPTLEVGFVRIKPGVRRVAFLCRGLACPAPASSVSPAGHQGKRGRTGVGDQPEV